MRKSTANKPLIVKKGTGAGENSIKPMRMLNDELPPSLLETHIA